MSMTASRIGRIFGVILLGIMLGLIAWVMIPGMVVATSHQAR
jgi:lipopolysaccharide export LptBFGC system permease protein LptF